MGDWFFDETIRDRGGFIGGAFVHCDLDPTPAVDVALVEAGLRPGIDEYKSGARMTPNLAMVRDTVCGIVQRSKIALVILPSHQRRTLGDEALHALEKFLSANNVRYPHRVYFDEGITKARAAIEKAFCEKFGPVCELHWNQKSEKIRGLQLADLVAHYAGTMLLAQLGKVTKKVLAGEHSGYLPEMEIELDFKLWAALRYSFFHSGHGIGDEPGNPKLSRKLISGEELTGDEYIDLRTVDVANYGLYIAPACDDCLRDAALARFGQCYLGCIH